jgi:hypothetical protein
VYQYFEKPIIGFYKQRLAPGSRATRSGKTDAHVHRLPAAIDLETATAAIPAVRTEPDVGQQPQPQEAAE